MKKLIVKTALVTLGSLLAVFLLLLTAMTMYAPRTMASLMDSVGNRSLSLWYTELAYQKFGETDDLTDVFDKAVAAEDTERTVKYGRTLTERADFGEICAAQDASGGRITYKNYVYGNTSLAMYAEGEEVGAVLDFAAATVTEGYLPYNAYQMLLYGEAAAEDKAFLSALKSRLEVLAGSMESETLSADILYLDKILQDLT